MSNALLVIDAQQIYTKADSELYCPDAASTIGRINKLIEHFQRSELPIFLIRHVHKADGSDLGRMFDYLGDSADEFSFVEGSDDVAYDHSLRKPEKYEEIVKNRYSAFAGTNLDARLKKASISRVTICGFMANFCCDSTARDAHSKDYFVDFIIDATGTPGTENYGEEDIRKIEADFMEAGFARVVSTEDIVSA